MSLTAKAAATPLTEEDQRQIESHGLTVDEVRRQLALLDDPPPATVIDRACTVNDGIHRLDEAECPELEARFKRAVAHGRFSKFVPASGAASRMFKDLMAAASGSQEPAARDAARRLVENLDAFPFKDPLQREAARRGVEMASVDQDPRPLLKALLEDDGLGYGTSAKALVPFHGGGDGGSMFLTAFEEHLVEAAELLKGFTGSEGDRDLCRLHFTIPGHQRQAFESHCDRITPKLEREHRVKFEIKMTEQGAETDTVAGRLEGGGPFRRSDGSLVFRPGGHGALLANLEHGKPDLVFIRNIDNIQPAHRRPEVNRWNRRLGGFLLWAEEELGAILHNLGHHQGGCQDPLDVGFIYEQVRRASKLLGRDDLLRLLDLPAPEARERLIEQLDRPLRVAGVVPNTGEPGGGPFWVVYANGEARPQIVELSQVERDDPGQRAIVDSATHFNPVHLVCRLRDVEGKAYDLSRFVDREAVFLSRKSLGGRELKALERPGLWNGAMAFWNTLFVEVPGDTFAPVKTVFDLLRPEHQPMQAD